MELGDINELFVDELSDVLRTNGLNEDLINAFKVSEIDGEQFVTLTREEFCDMFKILRQKRAAIAVWSKITGMGFDANGNPVSQLANSDLGSSAHRNSTPKPNKRRRIESDCSESDSSSVNPPSTTLSVTSTTSLDSSDYSSSVVNSSPLVTQRDWLKNYQLPNRFSCAVEAGLCTKYLTTNLINEMVRDVCTSMLNFTTHPKKSEREAVAKLVVGTYHFLKDPPINEDTKPWGSWEMKIQNRFKKLQRKKSMHETSEESIASKGVRPEKESSCWTAVPTETETNDDIVTLMANIKKEWKRGKKNHGKIREMMIRTYAKRRELVIVHVKPLVEMISMFPPLQNMLYIKADFAKVMGNPELAKQMKNNFIDVWSGRLLAYAKLQPKYLKMIEAMEQAIDSGCLEEAECKGRTALMLAQSIFRPPNKKGVQCANVHEEAVLKIVTDEQSLDNTIKGLIQPVIVLADNLHESNLMYVVAEGVLLCDITTKKISDALVVLLAVYYLYNVEHKIGKNIYCFLDMVLMGIVLEKCPVSVTTIIGVLTNVK